VGGLLEQSVHALEERHVQFRVTEIFNPESVGRAHDLLESGESVGKLLLSFD
jgi:hypothetical protein